MQGLARLFEKKMKEKEMMESLNSFNIEIISKKEIKHLDKRFSRYPFWEDHKRKVVKNWIKIQNNFNVKLQQDVKRFLRKLGISSDLEIEELMFSLERREFTTRRAMKQIEIPFSTLDEYKNKHAVWFFKNVKLFTEKKFWMSEIAKADLYLLKDELVWWDKNKNEIVYRVASKDVDKVYKLDYGLEVHIKGNKFILRYIDNEVLLIALRRTYKNTKVEAENKTREFELQKFVTKEFATKAEKTIEK